MSLEINYEVIALNVKRFVKVFKDLCIKLNTMISPMRKTLLSSIKLSELTVLERNSEFIVIAEAVAEAKLLDDSPLLFSPSGSHPSICHY